MPDYWSWSLSGEEIMQLAKGLEVERASGCCRTLRGNLKLIASKLKTIEYGCWRSRHTQQNWSCSSSPAHAQTISFLQDYIYHETPFLAVYLATPPMILPFSSGLLALKHQFIYYRISSISSSFYRLACWRSSKHHWSAYLRSPLVSIQPRLLIGIDHNEEKHLDFFIPPGNINDPSIKS